MRPTRLAGDSAALAFGSLRGAPEAHRWAARSERTTYRYSDWAAPHYPFTWFDECMMWDQRAVDLVRDAMSEDDPLLAVRLLQQALRFGRTGPVASAAYVLLATRHEDQGKRRQAIRYYTKSLEAWEQSDPYALFWRGELFFQQQEWHRAQADFESALAVGLSSPEHELAEQYLLVLTKRQAAAAE